MTIRLKFAANAIRKGLRRAILSLAQPPKHSNRNVPTEYYRFPLF
jgi:hypothetical protein